MPSLKLLTLNLHCFEESKVEAKQIEIAKTIAQYDIDLVFLQEVAQFEESPILFEGIKEGNYGVTLQQVLKTYGKEYFFYYVPIKRGFDKYDEGLGLLSKKPLFDYKGNLISKASHYHDWRKRMMLKGESTVYNKDITFVTAHYGWSDESEAFRDQFNRTLSHVNANQLVFIGGDFNLAPDTTEYSLIQELGYVDLFGKDKRFKDAPTHIKDMDVHKGETRIDYILCNQDLTVLDQKILFKQKRVSDHYGVYLEVEIL